MPPIKVIKKEAKKSLKDKWAPSMGIGVILLSVLAVHIILFEIFATVAINFTNDIMSAYLPLVLLILISPFFAAPLLYGALRWFWYTSNGANPPINEVFCFFSKGSEYLKAVSLSFRIFLRIIGIIFICFLPSLIVLIISNPTTYELLNFEVPYWASYIWFLSGVLNIFGIIMSFVLLIRYLAAPILMINDADLSPDDALNLSVIISKNAEGKTSAFLFSFIVWIVLSFLALPLIFTAPVLLMGYAVFSRHLIDFYNTNIAQKKGNYFTAPKQKI